MHNHRIDADGFEEHDIFGKVTRGLRLSHRVPTIFHHKGASGITLEIGQRLDQHFSLGKGGLVAAVRHGNCRPE